MAHISDEDLERYYLGKVKDAAELVCVEEHLLWCHECINSAEAVERYVDLIRVGLLRTNDGW